MMESNMKFIIASQSPRRKQLFSMLELPFKTIVSNVEEGPRQREECVDQYVMRLARLKSEAVAQTEADDQTVVIGADTIVSLDGRLLPKPATTDEAALFLRLLSGRTHDVKTGVAITHKGKTSTFVETTTVQFRTLDEAFIRAYVSTGDSLDKAGAYGIQTQGALLVESMDGDYYNVVGLPIARLAHALRALQLVTIGREHHDE